MRALLAVILLLAAIPLASAAPAAVTSVSWGPPGAPIEAAPGDTGRALTIGIQNVDTDAYTAVRATLEGASGITPAAGGDRASLSGAWAPGAVWPATFVVDIAQDAPSSATLTLRVTMQYVGDPDPFTRILQVPVRLTGHPVLGVSTDMPTLPSWSRVALPIEVRNVGSGSAGSLTLSTTASEPLTLADDGVRRVGGLAANASHTVDVSILTGAPGTTSLALRLAYADAAGLPVVETRTLALRVVDEAAASLRARLVDVDLQRGAPGAAVFLVENLAGATARDVSVSLAAPATASVLGGTDQQFLGDLAANATRTVRFELRPGADAPDALDITLRLASTDAAGVVRVASHKDALQVAPSTPTALRIGLTEGVLEAGRAGALGFDLENAGGATLRDVSVAFTLPTGAPAPFALVNATAAQRVGDLAPGETRRLSLPLLTSRSAQDVQPLAAEATWRDATGAVRSETYRFAAIVRGAISISLTEGTASVVDATREATIAGTLTNLGNAQAYNAYLRVGEGGDFAPTEAQFLGDLDPNSALPFSLDTRAVGAGTRAPILLSWNDEYGVVHEESYDLTLRSVEPPAEDDEPSGQRTPGLALPALLAALVLVALAARRKR